MHPTRCHIGIILTLFAVAAQGAVLPPTLAKSFQNVPSPFYPSGGQTALLDFNINNPNPATDLTSISFTDPLPTGLVVANFVGTTCGPSFSISAVAGSSSITVSGGSRPAGSGPCFIDVNVSANGAATGTLTNTTTAITSTEGGTGNTSTATIMVTPLPALLPPTLHKDFPGVPSPFYPNGSQVTLLEFVVNNSNNPLPGGPANYGNLTSISFTDPLPTGLVVANFVGTTCGPSFSISAVPGSSSITVSGGSRAVGSGPCFIDVNVSANGAATGTLTNTTTAITSTEGGTGNTATATIVVTPLPALLPPTLHKDFPGVPSPFYPNGSQVALLELVVNNPNNPLPGGPANYGNLTSISFTDPLPTGLVVANFVGASCGASFSITAIPGSSSITVSGGSRAAHLGPCFIDVNVSANGAATGTLTNTTTAITSTEGGTGNTSTATIMVTPLPALLPPTLHKDFQNVPSPFYPGNQFALLDFVVNNPNNPLPGGPANYGNLTNISFTDPLPAGLVVANFVGTTCGPTFAITAAPGSSSIKVSGASRATNLGPCFIDVNVSANGAAAGTITNTTTAITSAEAGSGNTATATVTVVGYPTLTKSFGAASVAVGATSSLSFIVGNPAGNQSLTNISFTDALPSGLVIASPNGFTGSCPPASVTASPGGTAVSLGGLTLAGGASCNFSVNVTALTEGTKINTTGPISSMETGAGGTASATIFAGLPPVITKDFGALAIPAGSRAPLTFTLKNPNASGTLTGIGFIDTLPAGLIVATPSALTNTCGGTATTTTNTIVLTGASLAPAATCTVTVSIVALKDGVFTNTVSVGSDQSPGNTASANIVAGSIFAVSYAANLNVGDSFLNFTNTGSSNGANLCLNLYAFDPAEELIACCTCSITPNGLQSLSILHSLIGNPLTPAVPTAAVVKAIATTGTCNASAVTEANLAPGALAWGTTLHQNTGASVFQVTERPFSAAALSAPELAHITSTCGFIQSNGSGFGICKGCTTGGLGAASANP